MMVVGVQARTQVHKALLSSKVICYIHSAIWLQEGRTDQPAPLTEKALSDCLSLATQSLSWLVHTRPEWVNPLPLHTGSPGNCLCEPIFQKKNEAVSGLPKTCRGGSDLR